MVPGGACPVACISMGAAPKPTSPVPGAVSQLPRSLDDATVAELARVLEERLQRLDAHQNGCPVCRDREAVGFLARMRDWLRRGAGAPARPGEAGRSAEPPAATGS